MFAFLRQARAGQPAPRVWRAAAALQLHFGMPPDPYASLPGLDAVGAAAASGVASGSEPHEAQESRAIAAAFFHIGERD